jgi:hypothetical protein
LIELSTRHNFYWLAMGAIGVVGRAAFRVTARKVFRGLSRESGTFGQPVRCWACHLTCHEGPKHYISPGRTSEAQAINEAEALAERFDQRNVFSRLHWLRGVFLAATGADQTQIETSFSKALRIAREQKSISLEKRAAGTYAEYHRQKATGSGGRGFRLPLW